MLAHQKTSMPLAIARRRRRLPLVVVVQRLVASARWKKCHHAAAVRHALGPRRQGQYCSHCCCGYSRGWCCRCSRWFLLSPLRCCQPCCGEKSGAKTGG